MSAREFPWSGWNSVLISSIAVPVRFECIAAIAPGIAIRAVIRAASPARSILSIFSFLVVCRLLLFRWIGLLLLGLSIGARSFRRARRKRLAAVLLRLLCGRARLWFLGLVDD